MLKVAVWNKSVPRVELDQRVRDARLQLERMEQLLVPRAAAPRPMVQADSLSLRLWRAGQRVANRPNPRIAE